MDIEQLYFQYEALIYNVLKGCQIYRQHSEYEDYLQELRMALYEELIRINQKNDVIRHLGGYLRNFLKWKCYNLLRRSDRQLVSVIEQDHLNQVAIREQRLADIELISTLTNKLSDDEMKVLAQLYQGYTVKEIARYCNKNERTIRRWRQAIASKYHQA